MPIKRLLRGVFLATAGLSSAGAAAAGQFAHDFTFTAIDGGPLPLKRYTGRALMIVNTASRCGFTKQYADLQALWERFRSRGLIVIGVPSDDFGGQEPGTESQIKEFCEVTFGIDFPMTSKERVSGNHAHPFYVWAAATLGSIAKPRWNFHKYLVAPDGRLVDWFSTVSAPSAGRVANAIEAHLPRP